MAGPDGSVAFWFEATAVELMDAQTLNTGYLIYGTQLHPFAWISKLEGSYLGMLCEKALANNSADLRWRNLRLPVSSKGLPKPSPSNWIDLGSGLVKKSGLETFAVPALVFSDPVSSSEMAQFLELLFDPEAVLDSSLGICPVRFVKSPSIALLERIIDLAKSLRSSKQFLPAITTYSPTAIRGTLAWHSILSRSQAEFVRSIIELGPAEFFSTVIPAKKGVKSLAPLELMRKLLDTFIDTDVRLELASAELDFAYDDLESKPIDEVIESLISPKRNPRTLVKARGRVPEILEEWRARLISRLEPAHLALRISPPGYFEQQEPGGDRWEVALGLYPSSNKELFLDAANFTDAAAELSLLQLSPATAELLFLKKLTAAAEHSQTITKLLRSSNPTRFFIGSDDVLDFVGGVATKLAVTEHAALMLPSILKNAIRPKIKVSSAPATSAPRMLGIEALFSYSAKVHLGEREVTADEIRGLIQARAPVVKVGSDWIFVDQDGLRTALRYLERHKSRTEMTLAQLLGDTMDDLDLHGAVEIERSNPTALIDALRFGRSMGRPDFTEPDGFKLPLRDYQRRGVEWLMALEQVGLGACLADDMGLGKTAQVIALLAAERSEPQELDDQGSLAQSASTPTSPEHDGLVATSATLIVAPVSVVGNWRRELDRFFPGLKVSVHHGQQRLDGSNFVEEALKSDVVITSYSLLDRDRDALISMWWRRVVLDEAQNVKNPLTATARAAQQLRSFSRIALTGTPVENHTGELWSIMNFINPSLLGSRSGFRKRFSIPIEKEHDQRAAQHLAMTVAPFILRRLKTDKSIVADLPDKIELKEYCSLSEEQRAFYANAVEALKESLSDASQMGRRGAILATITKLKQICNHPTPANATRLVGSSGKLDRLEELIEEILESDEKVIIFTQFAQFGSLLQHRLQERFSQSVPFLRGDVPMARRETMVADFQSPQGPAIFLLSLKAGGTGLNLTAANHVIHYDRWWNSAVESQASDRAFRIGQRKDVVVTKLICEGTLEERIDAIIESKRELAETLVSGGETWITEMSDDEVFELLNLGASQ